MPISGSENRKAAARTAFVAGGGGFLGSRICREMTGRGWRVISAGIGAPPSLSGAEAHHEGLLNRDLLASAAEAHGKPDVVVHAAGGASVGQSWENPRGDFDLSVGSMAEILDFIRHDAKGTQLVFVSSAAVYGDVGAKPLTEDDPCLPMSPYGAHKRVCEELAMAESRMNGLGVVIVRFFSLFGEGLRKQILWDMLRRGHEPGAKTLELWGDGGETRDFLHVEDAAALIALASENVKPGASRVLNGASGRAVSVRDLASLLLERARLPLKLHFNGKHRSGDPRHLTASVSRAKSELGFNPNVGLEEGLARYADWFRSAEPGSPKG